MPRNTPVSRGRSCKKCGADSWYGRAPGQYKCTPCKKRRNKEWRTENPERHQTRSREWYYANPDKRRDTALRRTFGIGLEEYTQLLTAQDGRCAICLKPEYMSDNSDQGTLRHLSVDHDHETGAIRGLLCGACNLALGQFKDSHTILTNALHYLERNRAKEAPIRGCRAA